MTSFVFALILLSNTELYTLSLEMNFFLWGGEIVDPVGLLVVAVFTGLVPVILYIILQKYIINRFSKRSIKKIILITSYKSLIIA